jgi:ACS family hexuronate transporter-like MFS transporter
MDKRESHYRWTVIGFAFIAIVITYLDRTALSYAIKPLKAHFGLTNTDFGLIAAAFGVGYLIMTVVGGILVDRHGSRSVWSRSAFLWSLMCILIGFATGFGWLFVFRMFLGLAEGPSFPAFTRVVADWLPVSERARALALGLAAVPFASVVGAPFISYLIVAIGWRGMFVILGVVGILWAFVWYRIFRDHPAESLHVSEQELQHIESSVNVSPLAEKHKTTWRFMLFNRALLVNNYAFFAFGYMLFFAITWLPGYLEQTYHVQVREIGWFLVAPWLCATVLLILGGIISDALWRKTQSIRLSRSHIIWVCQLLSGLSFLPLVFSHSLTVALISITFGVGFGLMPNAAFYAINADLARDRAATSLGIMDCGFAAAGILAPLLTGWLSTVTGNFISAISLLIGLTFTSAIAIILFQYPDDALNQESGQHV